MKPDWADERVYELFNEFINTCILKNDSFLTDEKNIISIDTIDDCITRFIVNDIKGSDSYEKKIKIQFEGASYETLLTFAHINWLWGMSPSDFSFTTKKNIPVSILGAATRVPIRENITPIGGFGDAGPSIRFRKYYEISFLILLLKQLKLKVNEGIITSLPQALNLVEKMCIECRYNLDNSSSNIVDESVWHRIPEGRLAMYNILLHLSIPEKYEPIASEAHKNRILNAFHVFIENASEDIKKTNREEQIYFIRTKVAELVDDDEFTFYDDKIGIIWGYGGNLNSYEYDFDPLAALQYKKSIVLYGPPGTSKTFSANQIAEKVILRFHMPKCSLIDYLKLVSDPKAIENLSKGRIHRFQLHTNYNYEDFIAGIKLVDGKTEYVKGDLLKLIDDKVATDEYPHVLILDEINRVDLSRLFGEFFTAIEERDKGIRTSVGGFILIVPKNLYVIGTMNEIDFSLERIDFALRRRFVWFPAGFSPETLREMIRIKEKDYTAKINPIDINRYINNAQELNNKIEEAEELSKQYQIGHTFFAEIVEINNLFSTVQGKSINSLFDPNGPIQIIWDISIKPIVEAFFGNMDKQTKEQRILELATAFLNG